ncbi:equilibrative nucleoside transporter 2 isoform X2 [Ambystoma mexicanum]|uniref:equilibrative nucleoside transporter 2 isoform X2 n=1 Tax=Ambystoma mexicanum TaxID=8296 RepID=UPI0037E7526B
MGQKDAPRDLYHMVGAIFFMLGLGTLLPWNFFITAIPYFLTRLSNSNNDVDAVGNATMLQEGGTGGNASTSHVVLDEFNFSNWMTLLSQLPLLLFTLLNSFLYQCIPDSVRIVGSMLGILLLFILTTILVKLDMTPQVFFSITMATIWFINSFCAILQGSLFGQLGRLPQNYSSLFLSGQGMAGMLAATAMLLSMASGVDAQTSALSYFVTPCLGTAISIICYLILPHLEFARYHMNKTPEKSYEMETKAELLQKEKNKDVDGPKKAMVALENGTPYGTVKEPEKASVFEVLKKIWLMALCIVLTFGATIAVFPAITASVQSSSTEGKWGVFFIPVCCFLLFNSMDWLGRSATTYILWPGQDSKLLPLLVSLRFIFVPLFMLCNIPGHYYLPAFFKQDAWFIIFMAFFASSNGYFVSLTMCLAPKKVLEHESEMAGALMTFFLALGLSCGAGLSFLFKALL